MVQMITGTLPSAQVDCSWTCTVGRVVLHTLSAKLNAEMVLWVLQQTGRSANRRSGLLDIATSSICAQLCSCQTQTTESNNWEASSLHVQVSSYSCTAEGPVESQSSLYSVTQFLHITLSTLKISRVRLDHVASQRRSLPPELHKPAGKHSCGGSAGLDLCEKSNGFEEHG